MALDAGDVRKVAQLANLALPEERLQPLAEELSAILSWIEQLAEVDTDGVEALTSCVAARLPMRADEVTDGARRSEILQNAPKAHRGFFVVPKVVE